MVRDGYWEDGRGDPLDYAPGDSITVDLAMDKAGVLSGTVVDLDGEPVQDATVRMHNVENEYGICDTDGDNCLPGGWIDDVLTDEDGAFSRWAHPRDHVGVVVEAPGFEPQVVYGAGIDDVLTITLPPGDGAFAPATVEGVLRDSSGAPLPGHRVILGGDRPRWGDREDVTDAGGRYSFEFAPLQETYWLDALYVHAGAPALHERGRAPVGRSPSGYYEPGAGYDVDLTLDAAGTVTGLVTDEAGTPLPGVVVRDVTTEELDVVATTDDAGRYEFVTYAGDFGIEFFLDGYYDEDFGYAGTVGPGETFVVPAQVLKDYSAPGAMRAVTASARRPHRAVVRGRLPADLGGSRLDLFAARCRGKDGVEHTRRNDQRPVVVKRLRPGRRYHCQLRAHNEYGWGPWSEFSDWFRTPRRRT